MAARKKPIKSLNELRKNKNCEDHNFISNTPDYTQELMHEGEWWGQK